MEDSAPSIAIFCDFENLAIGARESKYDRFDIHLVLERLLDKGKIVVKKAYAGWDQFAQDKRTMHEAAFEMVEIPHVSYSGKNSADIRLVVDALDLCYTKSHVDTFAILTGDSDFSPLVSKLRENNKRVIGVGVKNSSSDLLIDNCDEFIFYDELVRKQQKHSNRKSKAKPAAKAAAKKTTAKKKGDGRKTANEPAEVPVDGDESSLREEALEMVLDTVESLFGERDDNLWGSMVKQALKRKRPGFSESGYGYRTFNQLLEDAERKQLLDLQKDEKSGGYIILAFGPNA